MLHFPSFPGCRAVRRSRLRQPRRCAKAGLRLMHVTSRSRRGARDFSRPAIGRRKEIAGSPGGTLLTSRRCVARNIERTTFLCIFTARPVSNCQRTMSRKPGKTLKICSHIISVFLRAFGALQLPTTIYQLIILHSTFFILHSTFLILHSSFYILHFSCVSHVWGTKTPKNKNSKAKKRG